jgi:putative pyruvate formate lyase activating enzyme
MGIEEAAMKYTRREFILGSLAAGGSILLAVSPIHAIPQRTEKHWTPAYERSEQEGTLSQRIEQAYALFEQCECCPRRCGVNRLKGELGTCRAPARPVVYSAQPHFGEEIPLVGQYGSGTIFFSNCNLRCVFCQNWPISHEGRGKEVQDEDVAEMMLGLQRIGCHNINLVTPTHVMPNILHATRIAFKKGLRLPLVYNTSGYERPQIVKLLDGIVDIYMPDMKYTSPHKSAKYSFGAYDYPKMAQKSILEMYRQVGDLRGDKRGIALRGLLIRHLVMPNDVAGTEKFVKWVAENLSTSTYVNIMSQYRVEYRAYEYPEIARGITAQEFLDAVGWAKEYGLTNLDSRSLSTYKFYLK